MNEYDRIIFNIVNKSLFMPKDVITSVLKEEFASGKWDSYDSSRYDYKITLTGNQWPELHPNFIWMLEEFNSYHRRLDQLYISLGDRIYSDDELSLIFFSSAKARCFIINETSRKNIAKGLEMFPSQTYIEHNGFGEPLEGKIAREDMDPLLFNKKEQIGLDNKYSNLCLEYTGKTYFIDTDERIYINCVGKGVKSSFMLESGKFFGNGKLDSELKKNTELRVNKKICPYCGKSTIHPNWVSFPGNKPPVNYKSGDSPSIVETIIKP